MSSQRLWTLLRTAPTFSGVALLVSLLISLPWLPLQPDMQPLNAAPPSETSRFATFTSVSSSGTGWSTYGIHIVATDADIPALRALYPDADKDKIVALPPDKTAGYARAITDTNDQRFRAGQPALHVEDLRCSPSPPSPLLCQ